jgi:23S rRNA pseudouridine1911/1915/1917 synthase
VNAPTDGGDDRFTITADDTSVDRRVDAVVGADERVGSRAEAQRLIDLERVFVNGQPVVKRHIIRAGDLITVEAREREVPTLTPEAMDLDVAYEDEYLIVVNKPAGVVTHPSRGHDSGTLVHGLLGHGIAGGGEEFRPGIVHRLDRDTSGLLIVSKRDRAHRLLQQQLRDRLIDRRYLVLVHGAFPPALTIDQPIGRDRKNRLKVSTNSDTPRDARTRFRTVQQLDKLTLLEARLDTGRTHQIRVHLEFAGFPVVGDPMYGRGRPTLGLSRQFLHAWQLSFPHPETEEQVELERPLPPDLQAVLDALTA